MKLQIGGLIINVEINVKEKSKMPFKSKKQRAYLYSQKPGIAKEFQSETPKGKKLPLRVKRKKK